MTSHSDAEDFGNIEYTKCLNKALREALDENELV